MILIKNYFFEVKSRFFCFFLTLTTSFLLCYNYKETLLFFVTIKPINLILYEEIAISYFIFTNLTEIFLVYLKLTYFITGQFVLFYSIHHFFNFFSFSLYFKEFLFCKQYLKIFNFIWFVSLLISNYLIIPLSWFFFFSYKIFISSKFVTLHFEPKICEYLNFCIFVYFYCFFYFQVFVLIIYLVIYQNLSPKSIKKKRKYYYFFILLFINLVLVLPDITSQIIFNFILFFIFEIFVLISILKNRN